MKATPVGWRAWVALLVTREPIVYYVSAAVLFDGRGRAGFHVLEKGDSVRLFWPNKANWAFVFFI
jgi:hypothetical protein